MAIVEILGGDQSGFRSFQETSQKKKTGVSRGFSESHIFQVDHYLVLLTIDCVDLSLQNHKWRYT